MQIDPLLCKLLVGCPDGYARDVEGSSLSFLGIGDYRLGLRVSPYFRLKLPNSMATSQIPVSNI